MKGIFKIKTIYTTIILLFTLYFGHAQSGTIKGHIYSKKGHVGFDFATIQLNQTVLGGYTDHCGDFIIENVPEGKYDIFLYIKITKYTLVEDVDVFKDSITEANIEFSSPCQYDKSINNSYCPVCGKSDKVIPVLIGYPSNKAKRQSKRGRLYLFGCMMSDCDPNWYCKRDSLLF